MPELVQARGVTVIRRGRRILDGIDLTIDAGAPFAIVGESGAGKSTLLFALVGLLPIDAGAIEIDGARLADLDARARARKVGIVFQDYQLFPHLDVRGNLELAPRLHGLDAPERRATDLLARLGLDGLAHRRPHELSGGQRQRVAIARSLALEPRVLFFDEPSAALDPKTTDELADMLASLSSRTQIVVVSHDRPFVERVARRGVRLAGGRVVAEGSPGELM